MEKKKGWLIGAIYCIAIFYFVFKASYYYQEVDWGPDVKAHISYIYYEAKAPAHLVPKFEEIRQLDVRIVEGKAYVLGESEDVCYLCHPPLYYKLMAHIGCIKTNLVGEYIDMDRLHVVNLFLTTVGLILCLAFGMEKIRKQGNFLVYHLLFVSIVTTLPMIAYLGAGPTNDNLLYLIVGLFLYGMDRGINQKRDFLAYLLIHLSVAMAVMTKLTLGMVVVLGVLWVSVYIMIKEKSLSLVANKGFLCTLPIYLPAICYFINLKGRYGTFQPSLIGISWESYQNSEFSHSFVDGTVEWYLAGSEGLKGLPGSTGRLLHSCVQAVATASTELEGKLMDSLKYFWEHFWETWSMIYTHTVQEQRHGTLAEAIFWLAIMGVGIFLITRLVAMIRGKLANEELPVIAVVVGNLMAFLYHWFSTAIQYSKGGRMGGYQARYYICSIACFALCNVYLLRDAVTGVQKIANRSARVLGKVILYAFVLLVCIALFYYDFYYFLTRFHWYRNYL